MPLPSRSQGSKEYSWLREINLWGASLIQQLPTTDYKDIMGSKEGLKEW